MSATATLLSLGEFHNIFDGVKPNHEYWFGEAVAKSMPTFTHGALQVVLGQMLRAAGLKSYSEVTLRISPELELIPDVVATRRKPDGPYATEPVDLCVEILSPDDRLNRTMKKAGHYVGWGVADVWIVDPSARTAWMVNAQHPDGLWVHPDGTLTAASGIQIPLTKLFAEVDDLV